MFMIASVLHAASSVRFEASSTLLFLGLLAYAGLATLVARTPRPLPNAPASRRPHRLLACTLGGQEH